MGNRIGDHGVGDAHHTARHQQPPSAGSSAPRGASAAAAGQQAERTPGQHQLSDVFREGQQRLRNRRAAGGSPQGKSVGAAKVPSTAEIVKGLVSVEKTKEVAKTIMDSAARFVPSHMVLDFGDDPVKGGPAIGELTASHIVQKYNQKYGMSLALLGGPYNPSLDTPLKVQNMEQPLREGRQVSMIFGDAHAHSVPAVMSLQEDLLCVVTLNSLGPMPDDFSFLRQTLQPLVEQMELDAIDFAWSKDKVRQSDEVSCLTDALVILKDIHLSAPNLSAEFLTDDSLPSEVLRTTQRPDFLDDNDFEPNTVYKPEKGRTVGQHRDVHKVDTTDQGTGRNKFLHAKALQFAMSTVSMLESFNDVDAAKAFVKTVLPGREAALAGETDQDLSLAPQVDPFPRRRHFDG